MVALASRSLFRAALYCLLLTSSVFAEISRETALIFVDATAKSKQLSLHGAKTITGAFGTAFEFTTSQQFAELKWDPKPLHGIKAMSMGGWFLPRRSGEQCFFYRGLPEIDANGNRMFRPQKDWVNFLLGTDQHGFLMGTINGNGIMPFPHVTVNEVAFDAWNQLVVVKDDRGFQRFYLNGTMVHADTHAISTGKIWPFVETGQGEPVRLAMPLGGLLGEAWVFTRELSAKEIQADYLAKRERFKPALPAQPMLLREMDAHPATGLWKELITKESWPKVRKHVEEQAWRVLGPPPKVKVSLDPKIISEEDCGAYWRRKVSIQVQPGDRMPAWLLVPKQLRRRVPAIICLYGTTSGAGKDTTVGLSGRTPGTPPHPNQAFAVDMVEAGFVALAPDFLRDGERIKPARRPYDTTDFYKEFPDWSVHGKDIWDISRAIDYLQTLKFVDKDKIGMTGHSYGGHSTIFATAMEPRIKVAVANGPVSDFLHHGTHWAVPKGGGNSQSMPALRPYVLDHTLPLPLTFYEFTALIAPRPLLVGQAAGERRPMEEENYAAVREVYQALGVSERVRYHWYAGDHDYPPVARRAAVAWFKRWFSL